MTNLAAGWKWCRQTAKHPYTSEIGERRMVGLKGLLDAEAERNKVSALASVLFMTRLGYSVLIQCNAGPIYTRYKLQREWGNEAPKSY